jgi:hypothetical protein
MKSILWLFPRIVICTLLLSCSPSERSATGDLGAFMHNEILELGGRVPPKSSFPSIEASWKWRKDDQGIQIFTTTNHFNQVDAFYRALLGPPPLKQQTNKGMLVVYNVKVAGVLINYSYSTNSPVLLHIILAKPQPF